MKQGLKTTLTKAHSKNDSLRTTIPFCIRKEFGLKQGDELVWKKDQEEDQLILKVHCIKKEQKDE